MSGLSYKKKKIQKLKDIEFRKAYAQAVVEQGLAYQIKTIRLSRGWSQKELANKIGVATQSVISRLEDPSYGKYSLQTLGKLSEAFDVALSVRFISFGQLIDQQEDLSCRNLDVQAFDDECRRIEMAEDASSRIAEDVLLKFSYDTRVNSEYYSTNSVVPSNGGFDAQVLEYAED